MPVVETREVRERQRHISRVFNHFGLSTGPTGEGTKAAVLFALALLARSSLSPALRYSCSFPAFFVSLFSFRRILAQLGGKQTPTAV